MQRSNNISAVTHTNTDCVLRCCQTSRSYFQSSKLLYIREATKARLQKDNTPTPRSTITKHIPSRQNGRHTANPLNAPDASDVHPRTNPIQLPNSASSSNSPNRGDVRGDWRPCKCIHGMGWRAWHAGSFSRTPLARVYRSISVQSSRRRSRRLSRPATVERTVLHVQLYHARTCANDIQRYHQAPRAARVATAGLAVLSVLWG